MRSTHAVINHRSGPPAAASGSYAIVFRRDCFQAAVTNESASAEGRETLGGGGGGKRSNGCLATSRCEPQVHATCLRL